MSHAKGAQCVPATKQRLCSEIGALLKYAHIAVLAVLVIFPLSVKSNEDINAMKSAYIYYFSKFVVWEDFSRGGGDLTVCAVDPNPAIAIQLKKIDGLKSGTGKIHVELVENGTSFSVGDCNILFVTKSSTLSSGWMEKARTQSGLLVVADQGVEEDSTVIRFALDGTRLGFAINSEEAARRGLTVSAKLLQLATTVDGDT